MKLDTFFDNFALLAEAPNGVQELRELILELAGRGRLVPQDSADGPASELFSEITGDKERLIESGEVQKAKALSPVPSDELPHSIPHTWVWARLGEVVDYNGRSKVAANTIPDDAWLLDLGDIEKDTSRIIQRVTFGQRRSKSTKTHFAKGDVLYGKLRPYLNKVVVAEAPGYCTTEIVPLRIYFGLLPKYLMYVLKRRTFLDYVNARTYGINLPRLGVQDARSTPFPLPPLSEQERIVAKVDQLMALCDELEAAQQRKRETRERLNNASLDRLLAARDPDEFAEHWQRLCDHFDLLYDTPDTIPQLRQGILQLAVQGKLIPQDPNDEPDSELLQRIEAERRRKSVPNIRFDAPAFAEMAHGLAFPRNWSLLSLAQVALWIVDCPHSTPKWTTSGKICVRTNQFRPGQLDLSDVRFVSEATYLERVQRLKPAAEDILYSREGGILGIACRVPPDTDLCLGQRMMLIRPPSAISAAFLEMVLNSPLVTTIARAKTTGGAAPRVNVATVKAYPIPLPPLGEQQRIVARAGELMSLSDALEAKLTQAESESNKLVEATVHAVSTGRT